MLGIEHGQGLKSPWMSVPIGVGFQGHRRRGHKELFLITFLYEGIPDGVLAARQRPDILHS